MVMGVGSFSPGSSGLPFLSGSGSVPSSDRSVTGVPELAGSSAVAVTWLSKGPASPLGLKRTVSCMVLLSPISMLLWLALSKAVSVLPSYCGLMVRLPRLLVGVPCMVKVTAAGKVAVRSSVSATLLRVVLPRFSTFKLMVVSYSPLPTLMAGVTVLATPMTGVGSM